MSDTLTLDIFNEILAWAKKLDGNRQHFDKILLTNLQASRLRKLCEENLTMTPVLESDHYTNSFAGIPYESFLTSWEVQKRGAELIKEGKRVIIIKNES